MSFYVFHRNRTDKKIVEFASFIIKIINNKIASMDNEKYEASQGRICMAFGTCRVNTIIKISLDKNTTNSISIVLSQAYILEYAPGIILIFVLL